MPTYDYRCDTNGQVLEVSHRMSEEIKTWGDLCKTAGINAGNTALDSPVKRLATGGNIVSSTSSASDSLPPCATGGGCPGGSCGF